MMELNDWKIVFPSRVHSAAVKPVEQLHHQRLTEVLLSSFNGSESWLAKNSSALRLPPPTFSSARSRCQQRPWRLLSRGSEVFWREKWRLSGRPIMAIVFLVSQCFWCLTRPFVISPSGMRATRTQGRS